MENFYQKLFTKTNVSNLRKNILYIFSRVFYEVALIDSLPDTYASNHPIEPPAECIPVKN